MIAFQMLPRNCDTAYTSETPNIKRSGATTKTRNSAFAAYKQLNSNTDICLTSQQPQCFADDGTSMPIHKTIMFQPAAKAGFGGGAQWPGGAAGAIRPASSVRWKRICCFRYQTSYYSSVFTILCVMHSRKYCILGRGRNRCFLQYHPSHPAYALRPAACAALYFAICRLQKSASSRLHSSAV